MSNPETPSAGAFELMPPDLPSKIACHVSGLDVIRRAKLSVDDACELHGRIQEISAELIDAFAAKAVEAARPKMPPDIADICNRLRKHFDNNPRLQIDCAYALDYQAAEIARLTDAIATLRELRDYDGKLIASQKYELARRDEALRIAEEVLALIECVYRKNCVAPGEPSSVHDAMRAALETIRKEIK